MVEKVCGPQKEVKGLHAARGPQFGHACNIQSVSQIWISFILKASKVTQN